MKHKFIALLVITLFLVVNFRGLGATPTDNQDTSVTQKILNQMDLIRKQLLEPVAADTGKPRARKLVIPTVTSIDSTGKVGGGNHAVFGDYIFLNITSVKALMALADSINGHHKDTLGDVVLYINGNPMRDIGLANINWDQNELSFELDRSSGYLKKFYPEFKYLWSRIPVNISAGFKNGMMLPVAKSVKPYGIDYLSRNSLLFSLFFLLTMVVCFVILAAKTNLIRIGDNNSPFSLSLTQLSFWTIVVGSSFVYIWIVTRQIPPITGSTIALLSISMLTTAGSRLVDVRTDTNKALSKPSVGFVEDILKDELGYSVHRAQMVMWTLIMGIVFVSNVIRLQEIPQISESLLGLMGISSTAYVGLKTMENKAPGDSKRQEDSPSPATPAPAQDPPVAG